MTPSDQDDAEVMNLLGQARETMELGFAIDVVEVEEKAGRWPDLTRLEARRPDTLAAIVWFLVRRVAVPVICDALKVSPCTVNRVRYDPRWREVVVSKSQAVADQIDEILALKVENVLDEARGGKLPSAFDTKLLFDIRQLLTGGATARVESKRSAEEEESHRFFHAARLAALPPAGMVFEAEILGQLGGSGSGSIQPPTTAQTNTDEAETD